MTQTNAFALQTSDLNAFLFADVGAELNGSTLTILSTLARLGQDPWAEAARLARLPKAEAYNSLTASIAKMPLCADSAAGLQATASRLVQLLPTQTRNPVQTTAAKPGSLALPQWLPLILLGASLAIGAGVSMMPASVSHAAPTTQTAVNTNAIAPMPGGLN